MAGPVEFSINHGDILSFTADVVALKYAGYFFGADKEVALALAGAGVPPESLAPRLGDFRYVESRGCIAAKHVLFIGVPPLSHFDYRQIRRFALRVLETLLDEAPATTSLAMTIHGPGYGLDEVEALMAQFAGYLEAMQLGGLPPGLRQVSIVEKDKGRVQRLRAALEGRLAGVPYALRVGERWAYGLSVPPAAGRAADAGLGIEPGEDDFAGAGRRSEEKPHAFVAMPFGEELGEDMDDLFHLGIQPPVHEAGFLCERVDQDRFTGEIMERVRDRIETATVVIAVLTGANPNVYLEVGYAWGRKRPTILLVKDPQQLRFDVRGQRCLTYKNIMQLKDLLSRELAGLGPRCMVRLLSPHLPWSGLPVSPDTR